MADGFDMSIDLSELDAMLTALPQEVQIKVARKALKRGGDVMLGALLGHTPMLTEHQKGSDSLAPGELKAHATTTVQIGTKGEIARVLVGFDSDVAHIARFVNDGHLQVAGGRLKPGGGAGKRHRSSSKRGRVVNYVPGKHFLEAAFDESANKAVSVLLTTIGEELTRGTE